jgi:uncharacterized membrane protein
MDTSSGHSTDVVRLRCARVHQSRAWEDQGLGPPPTLVTVKVWALAHLLTNGDAGGMLLFGSFLAWAVFDRISVKKRGDIGAPRIASFTRADAIALGAGTLAYVAMMFLHPVLIGVNAIGG